MKRLLGGLKRSRPSFQGHHDEEERNEPESPEIEASQQVVWDDSPPSYKPLAVRDSKALVQKELSLLQGILGQRDKNGGGEMGTGFGDHLTHTPHGRGFSASHRARADGSAPNSLLRSFLNTRSPAPLSRASLTSGSHNGENGPCPPPSPFSNQNAPGSSRKRARPLQPLTNQLNLPPTTPGVSTKKEMITPGGGLMGGPTPSPAPPPRRSFFGDLARITQKRIKLPKIWGGGGGPGEDSVGETPQAKRSAGDSGNNGLLTILDKIEERLSQGTGPPLSDDEEEEPQGPVFHTAQEEERVIASLKEEEPGAALVDVEAAVPMNLDEESQRGRGCQAPMPSQGRIEVQVKESPDSALARSQMAQARREETGAGWLSRQGDSERRGQVAQGGAVKVEPMQVVKQQPPPSPVKQRQPWDMDDDELYTEDEWALILDGIPEEPAPKQATPPQTAPPRAAPQPTQPIVKQEVVAPPMAAPAPLPSKPAVPPQYQPRQTQHTQPSRPLPPPQATQKYMPSPPLAPPPSQTLPTASVAPSPSDYDASGPMLLTSTPPEPQAPTSFPYARFEILGVSERRPNGDIFCDVRDKVSRREGSLCVREDWSQCDIRPGDVVHVVWTCDRRIEVPGHGMHGDTAGQRPIDLPDRVVCSVDNRHNYLIVHPDVLVTPSSIMAAVECDRRAVLQERVQSSAAYSVAATMGNLKHEVTQELLALLNHRPQSLSRLMDGSIVGDVERCIEAVLTRQSVTLLALHIPYAQARRDLMDLIRPLVDWARRCYLRPKGSQFATNRQVNKKDFMEVHGAASIEESIWSASLGLKGKIDATLEITSRDGDLLPVKEGALVPLELKSGFKGRDNLIRHKAQVMVYSLLLADRYGATALSLSATDGLAAQLPPGVLAYVSPKEMDDNVILPNEAELRALLIARNRLARALKETDLPPVLFNSHACSRCFNVAECMTYQRALEPEDPSRGDPEMAALIDLMSGSMDATDAEYLRKWDHLISLEAAASGGGLRDTWHRPAAQVEHLTSRCLSDMVLVSHRVTESPNGPLHVYSFCRRKWASHQALSQCDDASSIPRSLLELSISPGDRLLISTESCLGDGPPSPTQSNATTPALLPFRHVNVAVGNVTGLTESTVEISCPKAMALPKVKPPATHRPAPGEGLRLGYEPPNARPSHAPQGDFCASLLRAPQASTSTSTSPVPRGAEHVIFRLDADSSVLNFSLMRGNLMQLFTAAAHNANANNPAGGGLKLAPTPGDDKRRRLIVHLAPPTFTYPSGTQARSPIVCSTLMPPPGCDPAMLRQEYQALNEDQREALEKVLAARDYALLLGMPGTGKTSTIGFVVRTLVCRGKRVLITSYTHSAVDNLLLKLREKGVHFLRLGRPSQVHPSLHDSVLDPSNCNEPSMDHLERRLNGVQVIATTCLGVRHPLLLRWRFDYCIVDEAGQIALPVCLGPLRFAETFVLVGDDNQLPPLVLSSEAREGGMGESLFTRLAKAHPPAVARLSHQYRMNNDIMSICNTLVYDNMLKCGDDARVGRARLAVPRLDRLRMLRPPNHPPSWLEDILRPNRCVIFLNTDNLLASERVEEGEEQLVSLEKGLVPGSDRECSSNLTNPTEARLVCQVVTGMLLAGVKPEAVAVISPLRAQLKLLRREMGHLRRVEVNTVDKYQGSDRDCIILSLVRSNSEGKIGELLRDRRRINVAVSRAKRKLILVGSKRTLMQGEVFKDLIGHLSSRGWILDLPPGGHELYQEKDVDVLCEVAWTDSPK